MCLAVLKNFFTYNKYSLHTKIQGVSSNNKVKDTLIINNPLSLEESELKEKKEERKEKIQENSDDDEEDEIKLI